MFYFAYGSNMSSRRLLARVPSARIVGVGVLPGYQMSFSKFSQDGSAKCCIQPDKKSSTLGVIFKIPQDQRYTLDRIEGQGYGYTATDVEVLTQSGESISAFTYAGTDLKEGLKPYEWYKHHVLVGAREHDLSETYINSITRVAAIEDLDNQRHQHEMSIYPSDKVL
ncbi:hypothetical protein CWE09_13660 [Aliidiomarina minuta]|uniref:Gamma-glutamylcyclotransferase n=1 Tax=Aliidiomarina minuta TaxID=880057 RepID=A0A432W174_9GAMM|nr:gamma-glutamylcyclotransferase family protein [Aliidiomarina minuta]RUO22974.1 hypothetical protein CWE09_13660 [Aliidiomarina minuta]